MVYVSVLVKENEWMARDVKERMFWFISDPLFFFPFGMKNRSSLSVRTQSETKKLDWIESIESFCFNNNNTVRFFPNSECLQRQDDDYFFVFQDNNYSTFQLPIVCICSREGKKMFPSTIMKNGSCIDPQNDSRGRKVKVRDERGKEKR